MRLADATILLTAAIFGSASPLAEHKSKRVRREVQYSPHQERANAVQEAFIFAWDGYYRYAFPNDGLHPVSYGYRNSRSGTSNLTTKPFR
jgi:mannosyl-oligosaccharide alpha-1,2-mannosidase